MNLFPSTDRQPHDELPPPYRIAVETILAEPTPEVDLAILIPRSLSTEKLSIKNLSTRKSAPSASAFSRRRWLTQVGGISLAGAVAGLLLVSQFSLRTADAWTQVVKAVRKQAWVRMRASAPDKSSQVEVWYSPAKRIGAGRFPDSSVFLDLDRSTLQRFDQKTKAIYATEPQSADLDYASVLDCALEAFATQQEVGESKTQTVKLLAQSSSKGSAGDQRWTDTILDYEDARRSPPRFRQVFRVPEGAELPISMREEWTWEGRTEARTYEIDYPATGPSDLFALDVPKDAKVVDLRPGEAFKKFLAEYSKQQSMATEPYSATVLVGFEGFKHLTDAFQVRCDAKGVSLEVVDGEQLFDLNRRIASGEIRTPEGVDVMEWWKEKVAELDFRGSAATQGFYFPHQVSYPQIGLPNEKARADFNPTPFVGPRDGPWLTIEDAAIGERRYWFDSQRSSMVVRWEERSGDKKPGDWIDTTIIDDAVKSPTGRWYPTLVRRGQVERSGEDLRPHAGVSPITTQVYRYFIQFE